jgi:hypothetical protein
MKIVKLRLTARARRFRGYRTIVYLVLKDCTERKKKKTDTDRNIEFYSTSDLQGYLISLLLLRVRGEQVDRCV